MDQVYLCKSGRSYVIPQEVFDEIVQLKSAIAAPPPAQVVPPASTVESGKE